MNDEKIKSLIGKCGFYCGSCPDYIKQECKGCRISHKKGQCYTFDCVDKKQIEFCGMCNEFPCNEIIEKDKATVLDARWLKWKLEKKNFKNR